MTLSQFEQDQKTTDDSDLKQNRRPDKPCCVSLCDDVYAMDANACIGCSSCPELE